MSYGMGSPTGQQSGQTNTGFYKDKIPKGYSAGKMQQYTPEQLDLFQSLFSHLGPDSFLAKLAGGDQDTFNQIEAPALKQFSGLQGNIASRFSGMGLGGRKNSGFQNTMNSAASNFAEQLQSQRQSLQQNAIKDLMGMSGQLLQQRPYEQFLTQKPQSIWSNIGGKLAGAIPGAVAGFMSGGPFGAAMGAGSSVLGSGGYNALPGLEDQFRTGQAYY